MSLSLFRKFQDRLAKGTCIPIFQHIPPALVLIFEVSAGQTTFAVWNQNSEVGGSCL